MSRFILTIAFVFSIGSIAFADSESDPMEFLRVKMAEVKGEIPRIMTDMEMPAPKCGTPVSVAFNRLKFERNDMTAGALATRPDFLPDTLGGDHILVHYAVIGIHAPYQVNVDVNPADGVPDYINRTVEIFEHVWNYETVTLGYHEPLPDSGRGGDDRYDVYVQNLGAGFYGFTNPEDQIDDIKANSFITVENDFAGSQYFDHPLDGLSVTAAHEFFHAIQFSYDAFEFDFGSPTDPNSYRPWWMEASSTWMEDVVYDNVNDYLGYLEYFLGYIWMNLGTFSYNYGDARSYHPYGACLWPIYLSEKYDISMIRRIWESCETVPGYNALNAMDTLLSAQGSSMSGGFSEFSVWNYLTGDRADPVNSYSEGAAFVMVDPVGIIDSLYYQPQHISFLTNPPEYLAANYIRILTRLEPGGIVVNFNGNDLANGEWHTLLLGYWPLESQWQDMNVDPHSGSGSDEFRNWDNFSEIIVIPTVSGITPVYNTNYNFDGWVAFDSTLTGTADLSNGFKLLAAYPSPFLIDGSGSLLNMTYSLDRRYERKKIGVWIYDASGMKVRNLPDSTMAFTSPGPHEGGITWDGKNDNNKYVSSGIYIIHMEGENNSSDLKIAVVNGKP